jgi:hypothetical protein
MREVEQPLEGGQGDTFDEAIQVGMATVSPAEGKEASPEHEIVLSQELIAQVGHPDEPAPPFLRLGRALTGLGLLALAWGCVVLVLLLASIVLSDLDDPVQVTLHFLLYLFGALAMIWLIVVALASLIAGAFSLSLALSRRDW